MDDSTHSWPQPVNIYDERTAYVDLSYFEEVPSEMWTEPGEYGIRRKRLSPETLSVEWRRHRDDTEWRLWRLSVSGPHLHAQSGYSLFARYIGWSLESRPIDDWIKPLIELTRPEDSAHGRS